MKTYQIENVIADVIRARIDLAALAVDESVTLERFAKCEAAENDLETIVTELPTTPWIPRDRSQFLFRIQSVNRHLRRVQSDIAALDVVLLECKLDELYRAFIALSFVRLLEFERDVLCDALVNCMKCSCGCGAFVPSGWIN